MFSRKTMFSVLCYAGFCSVAIMCAGPLSKPKTYLTEQAKEKYVEATYNDIKLEPRKYRTKKLKMKWVYSGESSDVRYGYKEKMTTRRYYYFRHPEFREEHHDGKVHVMFSRKNRKKLLELLAGVNEGTEIYLYGKLKKLAINKRRYYVSSSTNLRYFYVEDIDTGVIDKSVENAKDFNPADYKAINAKTLDLVAKRYNGKKISFTFEYNGREGSIDSYLYRLFPNENYFQFETDYYIDGIKPHPLRGIALIASKSNAAVIDEIIELTEGEKVTVYGTMKKYVMTNYSPPRTLYYIVVDAIKKVGANKIPAVPKVPKKSRRRRK